MATFRKGDILPITKQEIPCLSINDDPQTVPALSKIKQIVGMENFLKDRYAIVRGIGKKIDLDETIKIKVKDLNILFPDFDSTVNESNMEVVHPLVKEVKVEEIQHPFYVGQILPSNNKTVKYKYRDPANMKSSSNLFMKPKRIFGIVNFGPDLYLQIESIGYQGDRFYLVLVKDAVKIFTPEVLNKQYPIPTYKNIFQVGDIIPQSDDSIQFISLPDFDEDWDGTILNAKYHIEQFFFEDTDLFEDMYEEVFRINHIFEKEGIKYALIDVNYHEFDINDLSSGYCVRIEDLEKMFPDFVSDFEGYICPIKNGDVLKGDLYIIKDENTAVRKSDGLHPLPIATVKKWQSSVPKRFIEVDGCGFDLVVFPDGRILYDREEEISYEVIEKLAEIAQNLVGLNDKEFNLGGSRRTATVHAYFEIGCSDNCEPEEVIKAYKEIKEFLKK